MMPYLTFQKHDICDRRAEKCHIPESDQSVHVQATEQVTMLTADAYWQSQLKYW